jgi:glycosyltransferase involved in cell wall biosynthesis
MYETARATVFEDEITSQAGAKPKAAVTTRVALVGGFTPRRCGIATFTADIYDSLSAAAENVVVDVYAMTTVAEQTIFDPVVVAPIIEGDSQSFRDAAAQINDSGPDVVWLQHEFGLFGGIAGDMIFELVDRIAAPLIVTLHTVVADPDADQMRVMKRLVARASKLMVMSDQGRSLLQHVYGADADQILLIPHGVPDRPFGRSAQFKTKFGFDGKQVLMTFGLLSPGKGIEAVIAALPAIIADHPNVLYCIAGATHPNLVAREGEAYRERLHAQADALGVADHIHWIDAFIETPELLDLLEAADIYVTPYPGAAQSTSGTLSYAVALGKAAVSTPYVHAVELLADDHGVLVPFNDSERIAVEVGALLDDPERLLALQQRAYMRGRDMIWPQFAARCLKMIDDANISSPPMPDSLSVGIAGLLRICDDTGILQHSIHSVPNRAHGYCVDDNARALMLMNRLGNDAEPHRSRMTTTFAAFVESAWNEATGEYRNFMDYRRNWLEDAGSEDSCGRTLWALGATASEGMTAGIRHWAHGLFNQTAQSAFGFGSPRATAFAILGADYLLHADPAHAVAHDILTKGADRLLALYSQVQRPGWTWFETMLAYDNCRLSEAMIRAGLRLKRADLTDCGLATMQWIVEQQTAPAGHFRPVGSENFGREHDAPMPFDQQPVELWAAIDGAAAAFDLTGDAIWFVQAQRAYDWFGGANDRGVIVADPLTGTCHDGINPRGLNLNEGAESVLAYQLATCAMRGLAAKIAA